MLAHNHVAHTPKFPHGLNGFRRFWIPPEYIESGEWIQCPCGWGNIPHFAIKEHVEWWEDEIKKRGSLEAVHHYIVQELDILPEFMASW